MTDNRDQAAVEKPASVHRQQSAAMEREVAHYNPAENNYDLALDPRCLFGWGPGDVAGCHCMFGHACFRYLGHPGMCWDAGEKRPGDPPCHQRKRPRDWDTKGRTDANR